MAKARTPGGADFVARIVKDPKNPPDTLMLQGYLGASSEEGHTRIYFDVHLASYAEIPNDAILHTLDAPEADSLAATSVWIKREAVLIYGPAGSSRPKGTFLEGAIMQTYMPGAAATAPQAFYPSLFQPCPSGHPSCGDHTLAAPQAFFPSLFQPCQSGHPSCGIHTRAVPQAFFPSAFQPCPSHPHVVCRPPTEFAIATILSSGQICHTHLVGCGGGGHPTRAQFGFATITFQGQVCHTHLPGCNSGPHTM